MREFVADTHTVIWQLTKSKRLSRRVRKIFADAVAGYTHVVIPSIVLVETAFLMQRERFNEVSIEALFNLTEDPADSIYVYPLNTGVVNALRQFGPAAVPELADRIIAATALHLNLPLLTTDASVQSSKLIRTVW